MRTEKELLKSELQGEGVQERELRVFGLREWRPREWVLRQGESVESELRGIEPRERDPRERKLLLGTGSELLLKKCPFCNTFSMLTSCVPKCTHVSLQGRSMLDDNEKAMQEDIMRGLFAFCGACIRRACISTRVKTDGVERRLTICDKCREFYPKRLMQGFGDINEAGYSKEEIKRMALQVFRANQVNRSGFFQPYVLMKRDTKLTWPMVEMFHTAYSILRHPTSRRFRLDEAGRQMSKEPFIAWNHHRDLPEDHETESTD